MKQLIRSAINSTISKLPYLKNIYNEAMEYRKNSCFHPGHYYSPITDVNYIKANEQLIWIGMNSGEIADVDLNSDGQKEFLQKIGQYYPELPFNEHKQDHLRYYLKNDLFTYTDGIVLYGAIRHIKPKRIIEVGSGYSSANMLDTNDLFFNRSIDFTFIEPYAERLHSLISDDDRNKVRIIEKFVQDVPLSVFEELEAGDILFIDSTHVVKCGSDLTYILFAILPAIKPGVFIHFHDIFYPFEYPKEWVMQGRNWNENYFLRAFLMNNKVYKILLFAHYMHLHNPDSFETMPLCYKNTGGSLWLEKI